MVGVIGTVPLDAAATLVPLTGAVALLCTGAAAARGGAMLAPLTGVAGLLCTGADLRR